MNCDTGHLVRLGENEIPPVGYEPVPDNLLRAANKKLAGKNEAYVSLTSGGKLSRWAAKQRKAKRKVVRASRRRNRHQ